MFFGIVDDGLSPVNGLPEREGNTFFVTSKIFAEHGYPYVWCSLYIADTCYQVGIHMYGAVCILPRYATKYLLASMKSATPALQQFASRNLQTVASIAVKSLLRYFNKGDLDAPYPATAWWSCFWCFWL